jgi:hypothetical protein
LQENNDEYDEAIFEKDEILNEREKRRKTNLYLFCININTKYLVVYPLIDKSAA